MLLLAVLILVLLYGFYLGFRETGGIYQFSFLAAAVFAGFVLPQLIGLQGAYGLPKGGWNFVVALVIASLVMCYVGSRLPSGVPARPFHDYDHSRLFWISLGFTLISAAAYIILGGLPKEQLMQTRWSGAPVAYLFFAKLAVFGLAISLLQYFRTGQLRWLVVLSVPTVIYLHRIIFLARREDAVEAVMVLLLAYWFARGKAIRPSFFVAAIVAASVIIPSIGDYRGLMSPYGSSQPGAVRTIDRKSIEKNFDELFEKGGSEMKNAIFYISFMRKHETPNWGLAYYNEMVRRFVPAQLLGDKTKTALLVDLGSPIQRMINYRPTGGSTLTGFVDSYAAFGMLAPIAFMIIAWHLRRLYDWARRGSMLHQIMYMTLINDGMQAITHNTSWYLGSLVYTAIFLLPVMRWARTAQQAKPNEWPLPQLGRGAYAGRVPS